MDRWTASETCSVSLTAWMSLVQKAENCSTFRKTWSASSRVGTSIRAAVKAEGSDWFWSANEAERGADRAAQ
jgi:hypothetical protein